MVSSVTVAGIFGHQPTRTPPNQKIAPTKNASRRIGTRHGLRNESKRYPLQTMQKKGRLRNQWNPILLHTQTRIRDCTLGICQRAVRENKMKWYFNVAILAVLAVIAIAIVRDIAVVNSNALSRINGS